MFSYVVDAEHACGKIAEFYINQFTDIKLYARHTGPQTVKMGQIYVPMTWTRYIGHAGNYKTESISNIEHIFKQVSISAFVTKILQHPRFYIYN